MKLNRSLLALLCAVMFAGLVYAEDAPAPDKKTPATKPDKKEKSKMVRVILPWKLIESSLTADQKEKLAAIHAASAADQAKIKEKEDSDCMAVLTEEQKTELSHAQEKEKADAKEKKGAGNGEKRKMEKPATKPAAE